MPILGLTQNCENSSSLFLEKGKELAYQVMKKISPNTGKNLYLKVNGFLSPNPIYSSKLNKCIQSIHIEWTANRCSLCSEELNCRVSGDVMYNYSTKSWEFEIENVNDDVKDIESWNENLTIGSIVAITGAVIYASSSSSNSKSNSNYSSSSSNSSTNNYSNSSSSSFNVGNTLILEANFSTASGEGWIGGVFFRNKYIRKLYWEVKEKTLTNGDYYYKVYCYDGKVGYNGDWVSYNQLKGYSDAENSMRAKINEYIGKTTSWWKESEMINLGFKKE